MRIGLLRHGRTDWNNAGLLQGRTDRPLDDAEAERLCDFALPPPWDAAKIIASSMIRAVSTANILTGKHPQTDPRLVEINLGYWEGKTGRDLRADPNSGFRDVEYWGWDYRPPNGESPREVWDRVSEALDDLSEDTLIVCHMVVMRVVLAKAYDWGFEGQQPFQIKRDRIYGVSVEDGKLIADPEPVRLVSRCA